jgi:hypothetical protein
MVDSPRVIAKGAVFSVHVVDGSVPSEALASNSIENSAVVDGAFTTESFASGVIESRHLQPTIQFTTAALAKGSVLGSNIASESVSEHSIVDLAVTSAHIADRSLTSNKFEDNSIETRHIVDGSITAEKLASSIFTYPVPLKAGSITGDNLENGAVTPSKWASNTLHQNHFASGAFTGRSFGDEVVCDSAVSPTFAATASLLGVGQIEKRSVASDAFTSENLASLSSQIITGSKITGRMSISKFSNAVISSENIAPQAISISSFGRITSSKITDHSILASSIPSDFFVDASIFENSAITASAIAEGAYC